MIYGNRGLDSPAVRTEDLSQTVHSVNHVLFQLQADDFQNEGCNMVTT